MRQQIAPANFQHTEGSFVGPRSLPNAHNAKHFYKAKIPGVTNAPSDLDSVETAGSIMEKYKQGQVSRKGEQVDNTLPPFVTRKSIS